jgi:biotin carboxylase
MSASSPARLTILCLASYHKGFEFLRELRRLHCRVLLVTSKSLEHEEWPRESIDEIFYMPDRDKQWDARDTLLGVSHLARTRHVDRIVPLDDFDLEKAAALREHLRMPGMGESQTRFFRDKLAMRGRAAEAGVPVPPFVHLLNDDRVCDFIERIPAPWILKPRLMAGTIGIRKLHSADELWLAADSLGDQRSFYLVEQFVPGDILHVDSVVWNGQVVRATSSRYGVPPFTVSHGGGVFSSRLIPRGGADDRALQALNASVLAAFGLSAGVSHTEYIHTRDGGWLFLETSARVGGAHIADLVEIATGANLWAEWAKVEVAAARGTAYAPPPDRGDYAGLITSLARQDRPDTSAYTDPEIAWRLSKQHHVGFIVRSPDASRVERLIESYVPRIAADFGASLPMTQSPSH